MSKTATPAPETPARTGGSLTTNPIQKAVNGCMRSLATLERLEHRETACRILAELLASERPGQSDAWKPVGDPHDTAERVK